MARQKAKGHTHQYRLVPMNVSQKVWACGLPDCNHYMPPNMQHMIEGKASLCWDCGQSTIMSIERMKFAIETNEGRMLCENCIATRKGYVTSRDEDIESILASLTKSKFGE